MDLAALNYLVTSDWLAQNLDAPGLRIVECTSQLPNYFEASAANGLELASGRPLFDEAHIPGATYVDLLHELSDRSKTNFMYAMPAAEQFAKVMSAIGVGNDSAVVLYDRAMNMWAARIWWMLRYFGFDNAAVLDGGWTQWLSDGRETSTAEPTYPPAEFVPSTRAELIATQEEVREAINHSDTCLINALDPDEFAGRPPQRYARPGRIPGSVNVPFPKTVDVETQHYADNDDLKHQFEDVDALNKDKVIAYCGGGIAACSTALLLTRLGVENVAVYDGSMTEWASNPDLPMETG